MEIQTIENGYLIKHWEEDDDGEEEEIIEAVEETDDEDETIIKLLYRIAEILGIKYDKFGTNNLNINFNKKGYKVDD